MYESFMRMPVELLNNIPQLLQAFKERGINVDYLEGASPSPALSPEWKSKKNALIEKGLYDNFKRTNAEHSRNYYHNNFDKVKKRRARYYQEHKEKLNAERKKYSLFKMTNEEYNSIRRERYNSNALAKEKRRLRYLRQKNGGLQNVHAETI